MARRRVLAPGWERPYCLRMMEGVFLADNLEVLRRLPAASVDLVYIDPPFGTGQVRRLDAIRTGSGDKARHGFAGRRYPFEVVSSHHYSDQMSLDDYLGFLYERLAEIHRALCPAGSLYLHLDFHAVHYGRLLLDEVFGPSISSTRSSGLTTTGDGHGTDGPGSTTTSSGTRNRGRGPSTPTTSTASPTWLPVWSAPKKRLSANFRQTRGG